MQVSPPGHSPALVWFREDLRIDDHPALAAAAVAGPVYAVFILEEGPDLGRPLGGASRWWLHHSLTSLSQSLAQHGINLILKRGDPRTIIPDLARELDVAQVHWNRRYYAWSVPVDRDIKDKLRTAGLGVYSHKAQVLTEPWEVKTGSGGAFKVFTPFFRAATPLCDAFADAAGPMPTLNGGRVPAQIGETLADWALLPSKPDWSGGLQASWQPGEAGARARLDGFLAKGLKGYGHDRNLPAKPATSGLSAHLHFGEISIRRVWQAARAAMAANSALEEDGRVFLSELCWREFSFQLIYHYPDFPEHSWKEAFRSFPWTSDPSAVRAWQRGQTGYPIVDAGMRQLWKTGWMHNRVRMIVASFLVKHLLQDWRVGEAWFWDTLVDADVANNAAGWQWVAGCGADAAPYFRIFNPMAQGEKFDADGAYVRTWVPELARLPDRYIHRPFECPTHVLAQAGVRLGQTYPLPIVNHEKGRKRALDAFASLKETASGDPA
ncbi:deoxyribodipyrimidine photo-lyase [Candidatus Phycosocius bacilliformis]|uniref:Deoxyribodipyrimidine photo-lyase n=1 Tax=Candidatus Phycosocius bacilliformis TaxID=1445552 RepID=A0A2P2E844_9PROT|nr:deoxyribodipyrimidine photo-lyase [Candidatus Phycosocius bacilliformis]GBF57239.1 deoxyribodipyrimidine photo-lyase [Candidatus Phycosocius bacilliformis]